MELACEPEPWIQIDWGKAATKCSFDTSPSRDDGLWMVGAAALVIGARRRRFSRGTAS
jgi:MYXO-CTERM domain-containing protein